MNRTLYGPSEIGGYPLDVDDLEFDQLAVRRAFFGWLSGFGVALDESFIISGCTVVVNGSNLDISAGFLSFAGEILEVDAHSIVDPGIGGDQTFWQRITTFDPAGDEVFEDTSSHQTYEVNRGRLTSDASPPATFFEFDRTLLTSLTLAKILTDNILNTQITFNKPTSWKFGSQTNNDGTNVDLALDGSNYETIMNQSSTNHMKLIDDGAIVTLHMVGGLVPTTTFFDNAGGAPAGFGIFRLGNTVSVFLVGGDTISFQQRNSQWFLYAGSFVNTLLFSKKDADNFARQSFENSGAALPNAVETVITSGSAALFGTSTKMVYTFNTELITGANAVTFDVRLYIDGNLIKEKQHNQPANTSHLVTMMHCASYASPNVVEWRIQPSGNNASFVDAISISDANNMIV